ncbi:hypothetical protein BH11CYA1_BH11CYA1_02150 [soil metagenome]
MPIEKFDHAPDHHSQPTNWFEAAYEGASTNVKGASGKAVAMVKEHPVESAVVAGVAVVGAYAMLKGKGGFSFLASETRAGEGALAKVVKDGASAEVGAVKTAFETPALARKTIDGAAIPDVARPLLEKGSALTTPEALAATAKKYESGLSDLFKLPRETVAEAGQSLDDLAAKTLQSRAATTGERFTEMATKAEAERLASLNPSLKGLSDLGGSKVTVLDQDHLVKLAGSDLQFKFTPQLGQFLKAGGKITEEHIGEAFAVQKGGSKKLLGEILVDLKHATTADVEQAFADQNTVKAALKAAREEFLKKF